MAALPAVLRLAAAPKRHGSRARSHGRFGRAAAQVRPRAAAPSTHTQIVRALHEQGAGRPCVL